jgi:hypothetical protein
MATFKTTTKTPIRLPVSAPKVKTQVMMPTKLPTAAPWVPSSGLYSRANATKIAPGAQLRGFGVGGGGQLTPIQAIGLVGSARGGDGDAAGALDGMGATSTSDKALIDLATAIHISAEFVARWFGQAQADTLLTMGHLGS